MFFERKVSLFRLLGFEVRVDPSWLLVVALVVWTLATGYFPHFHPGLARGVYWLMGLIGAAGLFFSVVVHELSHSLVARRHGMDMSGITLFIFGGVAEMKDEPPSPRAEFLMAAVGPLTSLGLAVGFFALHGVARAATVSGPVLAILSYLAVINGMLAVFNLVPAFPLDGGRMLRAGLWKVQGNRRRATRVSSAIGSLFGVVLVVLGVIQVFRGQFIGGMWWFLIGMFLQGAAKGSYQQLVTRQALEGEPLRRFMKTDPVTVPSTTTVDRLVEDYVYRHHYKMFPVTDGGRLSGCVTTRQIKDLDRERWSSTPVGDIASPCGTDNSIAPDADALDALMAMHRSGSSRLLVRDGDDLVGIVSLKDLMGFIALKMEIEDAA